MNEKMRLDHAMVQKGLAESREQAKRLILAGQVTVNGQVVDKPAVSVSGTEVVAVREKEPFVSRGGLKLRKAIEVFQISLNGKTAADIGASTGGFTDCLLQRGAAKVFAVDVGKGQLHWSLRNDPRVIVMEGINARYLSKGAIPEAVDIATIDVSFISLEKIIPAVKEIVKPAGAVIALIKPQFEAERKYIKKGVVKDPAAHEAVVQKIREKAQQTGFRVEGVVESPILGPAGNKEFLVYLKMQE